jgi:ABC-type Fe3+-hydroxamate transport system substrate-binding protein
MRRTAALAAGMLWALSAAGDLGARDDRGVMVRLPVPALRIVSLAPHVTEILFAAGAGAQVVGVSAHSDYPPAARMLPVVAGFADLDPERVLALRPDLVAGWISGSRERAIERIAETGVPIYLTEPRRAADVERALANLGLLTGHERQGREAAARLHARIEELRARHADRLPVKVLVQLAVRPILSLGSRHFFGELLEICGGRNIAGDTVAPTPVLDPERVLASAPEIILFSSRPPLPDEVRRYWDRYPSLPAVRAGNLRELDDDLVFRPGPRLAEGAAQVCELLERAREGKELKHGGREGHGERPEK